MKRKRREWQFLGRRQASPKSKPKWPFDSTAWAINLMNAQTAKLGLDLDEV
jgi:hypothetical protein